MSLTLNSGFVRTFHFPFYRDDKNPPMASLVICKVGNNFQAGFSICSEQDQFCKRIGRKIAFHRMKGKPIVAENADELLEQIKTNFKSIFRRKNRAKLDTVLRDLSYIRKDIKEMKVKNDNT